MARNFDHERLTAEAFSAALDEAKLSTTAFEFLTGASRNSVRAWLLPASHPKAVDPPFWVTSWLALYLLPGGRDRARAVAESKLIGDDDE